MKSILVIDEMPKMCNGCPLKQTNNSVQCRKTWTRDSRPNWCPLKPMPERKGKYGELNQYDTDFHYEIGWNECLDEILGGKEWYPLRPMPINEVDIEQAKSYSHMVNGIIDKIIEALKRTKEE